MGRRLHAVVLSAVMVLTMLVGAPAVAQDEPDDVDWGASSNFDKVLLEDDIGEPMTLDIASDGRVFLTDRTGVLRIHDQATGETTIAAEIDTYSSPHYPGGNNEGGLLGVALDPDFDDNQRIYLYYSDPVPEGDQVFLSRFEMDGDTLDLDSEIVLLEVPSQREACCHLGGDLQFGPQGDLYLSTGDETLANCADQYAPINEDPDSAWFPHCDAQGTAGDASDLRGSVLRIIPLDDPSGEPGVGNTYDVPGDNLFTSGDYDHLFPDGEYDPELGRPEIYVMGARNPFRIAIDSETGWLYYGMYGPNNPQWHDERGPMGFDQYHQAREASNQGWPYCTGNLYAYRPWDFAANEPKGDFFDCEGGPVSTSPNNGGIDQLPPVTPAIIYYPTNWAGYPYEVPEPFLNLGSGAGGPNSGPIYRYDEDLDSDTKFPEHFDGRWFLLDSHRDHIKTAELDEDGDLVAIDHFMDATSWAFPHAAMFGPEGSLYVIEYGNAGGFQANPDAALYRIDWVGESDDDDIEPCLDVTTDGFDGDELDRDIWTEIVRENPDGYRVEDGHLVIDTLQGDMIREITTAQNLILQPLPDDGAWQATIEFDLDATEIPQQAGLIIYDDDGNFLKAPLMITGSGWVLEYLLHVDGELRPVLPPDVTQLPDDVTGSFHLRITSDGSDAIGEYSYDGEQWTTFGRPAPLDGMENPRIGLMSVRGPDEGPVGEALFDWFSLGVPASDAGPDDDFEGDELDRCIWPRIVRPDPDGYRVTDGALEIDTLQGDMIINAGNPVPSGQNLIMQPLPSGVGWEATTEITIDAQEQHQHAGFVVYGDDDNFIKAALQSTGNFEFLLHQNGELVRTDGDVHPVPGGHPVDYQVRLTSTNGTSVSVEYSLDEGETWTSFGSTLPLPDDPHIALYAARGPNPGEVIPAQFHWFTLEEFEPECPDLPEVPDGFSPLYDGETLDGWTMAGPGGFEIDPCGLLQPYGGMGLLWYEDEEFTDYVLQVEFRQQNPADNSGVFVRFPDPQDDPWNPVDEGFEIQIYEATTDPLAWTGAVYTFAPAEPLATNPLGEWNTMQIEVVGDTYTVTLNDVEVSTYTNPNEDRGQGGYVGLQNHAAGMAPGDGVEFRGVWIQDLDDPGEPAVEASLDPQEPDGNDDWYVSPVTLTLEADSSDAATQWRESGDEDWNDYDGPVTFDTDGTYDIEYRLAGDDNGGGNGGDAPDEATVLAGVDGDFFDPDEVTITQGGTVTFEAATGGHNVLIENSYGDQVGLGGDFGSDWVYEFTPEQTGMYTFRCQPHPGMVGTLEVVAGNGGGDPEIGEVSFRIDQTPPETDAELDGDSSDGAYVGEVVLTLDAEDATSGVAETHWREVGEDHLAYEAPVVFDEPGAYAIEFRSVDVAGNVEEWQEVTFEIVEDGPPPGELELEVAASVRCVAGSVYVTVTARNDSEVPVDIELDSEFGSRAFVGVVPDRFASHAFNTREGGVDGGSVTVRGSAVVDGVEVEVEETVDFEALSCD